MMSRADLETHLPTNRGLRIPGAEMLKEDRLLGLAAIGDRDAVACR